VYDDPVRFENATAPGFLEPVDHFEKGLNHGQQGQRFDGPADYFLHGAPFDAPRLPPCVNWQGLFRGRVLLHGSYVEPQDFTGRLLLHGSYVEPDRFAGRLLLHGSYAEGTETFTGRLLFHGTYEVPEMFSGARAHSSTVTLTMGSASIIAYSTVEYDTDDYFDLGTDDTLITIPTSGIYGLGVLINFGIAATDTTILRLQVFLSVNGSPSSEQDIHEFAGESFFYGIISNPSWEREFAAGDVLTWSAIYNLPGGTTGSIILRPWISFRGPLP
jgi:hypothetical protein